MATKSPRINVTLDKHLVSDLKRMARKKDKSISNLVQEFIMDALDREEDRALSRFADDRDHEKSDLVSHEDAWK